MAGRDKRGRISLGVSHGGVVGGWEGHPRSRDGAAVLIMEAAFAPFIPPGLREGTLHSQYPLSLVNPLWKALCTPRGVFYNLLIVFQTNQVDNIYIYQKKAAETDKSA